METTIVYWGLYGDNGKENGNTYSSLHMALGLQPLWWVLKALYDLIYLNTAVLKVQDCFAGEA